MEKSEYLLKKFKIFKYWRNIYWRNSIKENPGLNEFHWWIPLITEGEIIPNSFTEKNEGSNLKSQSDSPIYYLCDHRHYLMSLLFSVFMCKKENNKNIHINVAVRIKYV